MPEQGIEQYAGCRDGEKTGGKQRKVPPAPAHVPAQAAPFSRKKPFSKALQLRDRFP